MSHRITMIYECRDMGDDRVVKVSLTGDGGLEHARDTFQTLLVGMTFAPETAREAAEGVTLAQDVSKALQSRNEATKEMIDRWHRGMNRPPDTRVL